jgi:hypothetical protein
VFAIYYDHAADEREQNGFRSGEAGLVMAHPEGGLESDRQVWIPPNSLHALEQHGVVAQLNQLPLQIGPIAPGRDAVLEPRALDDAARIFYEADRKTYGNVWEFIVGVRQEPEPLEYRIVIDNRGYQRSLSQLQFLVTSASRRGFAVRLRL